MRGLIRYIIRNHVFILFLLLQILSFVLIFNYNNYQRAKYFNSANYITASVYNTFNSVVRYFGLNAVNEELALENARLKSLLKDSLKTNSEIKDTTFRYISAYVINNSVNKQSNYITLNKGRKHGIKTDQGIIGSNGIVGVVTNVSESYSMGLSVLNQRWGISAKLKNNGFFGSISWEGGDYRTAELKEIPFHVELNAGDTIVTSSYSMIFPEGIMIGTIQSFEQPEGDNYYKIYVKLSTDFKSLSYVHVVDNLHKEEINQLKIETQKNEITD